MNKKIGVVILSYRNIDDTIECIKSIRNCKSEKARIEIYLIDNSEDRSYIESILKAVEVDYSFTTRNDGYAKGNNVGIKNALHNGCNYIIVLNNDTIVEDDFVDPLIEALESDKSIALAAPLIISFYNNTVWSSGGKYRRLLCDFVMSSKPISEDTEAEFITGCCFAIKAETIKKIGLLSEKYFMYSEDADYCYRILKSGYKNKVIKNSKIYHKVSNSSGIESPFQMYYIHRNRILFANECYSGIHKVYAISINILKALYWIVRLKAKGNNEGAKAVEYAINDALKRTGRYRY